MSKTLRKLALTVIIALALVVTGFSLALPGSQDAYAEPTWSDAEIADVYAAGTPFQVPAREVQIDASTTRYERAVKNGGGRPSVNITIDDIYEQIEVCDTWKEIAAALKIDADTLRAIRQKYGLTERNPRKYKNSENRKTEKPRGEGKTEYHSVFPRRRCRNRKTEK